MNNQEISTADIMAFILALGLDIFGIVCVLLDESLSLIPDFLGLLFLGSWRRITKRKSKKFWLAFLGELIPYLGSFVFWLLYTFSEIINPSYGKKS